MLLELKYRLFFCAKPDFEFCFITLLFAINNYRKMKLSFTGLILFTFFSTSKMSAQNQFSIEYVTGKFDPTHHPDFTAIASPYTQLPSIYMRKDAYEAFKKMYDAAAKEKIYLPVVSATRNFEYQKGIWERKWLKYADIPDADDRAKKILEYSSMPGTSRHHWGTDLDLVNLNNEHFDTGEGIRTYDWLLTHASEYGFCQPYTAGRKQGYKEEKWHWSYMPVSNPLTIWAKKNLNATGVAGFLGAETAVRLDVVHNYVLGINKNCY